MASILFLLITIALFSRDVILDTSFIINFIRNNGYSVELHKNIQTEDDYLLDMHRIPHGRNNSQSSNKPVVFLMHGLLGSAENWIVIGQNKGLAFLLADLGYDVWMGNARGTLHSRKHVSLNPDIDSVYWQFSWHEIGVYDLPAMLSYVLKETNQQNLSYIGHSQGTTTFFVLCSMRPEYNLKVNIMIALAPVVYLSNSKQPIYRILSLFEGGVDLLGSLTGFNEFVPNNGLTTFAGEFLCRERIVIQELCANALFLLTGYDSEQLNRSTIPDILHTTPAGASVKQFVHFGQVINSHEFRQYDFGLLTNLQKYVTVRPPIYDLTQILAPVALFYAKNDLIVSTQDIERLSKELPNVVLAYLIPYEKFNHLDYLFATDVVELLYSKVFDILGQFNGK